MDDEYDFFNVGDYRVFIVDQSNRHVSFRVDSSEEEEFHGCIKANHTSDWDFCPDNRLTSFSDIEDVVIMFNVVKACYKYAEDNLENWDD